VTKQEVSAIIEKAGILPAVRVPTAEDALFAIGALFRGGLRVVELTMTVPGAIDIISELARTYPSLVVGAGTVVDLEIAQRCLDAGAAFLTSPGFDPEMVNFAAKKSVVSIPGALTPTEVMMANKCGADYVKVFPCSQVGGASYIRALKAPFPHVSMIASGGVNQTTARDFIVCGAVALGIRGELIPRQAVARRNEDWIHELIHRFLEIVRSTRAGMEGSVDGRTESRG
jgi:2-dehydro-3-deoxyphosphogluconate aldolase/(4S)-4-hydroxy-2-oxoglutarate aldolase